MVPSTGDKLYVSSIGRVWQYNTQRRSWIDPKTPSVLRHGYPTVVHQKKIYRVHWLMAVAFIGPQPSPDHSVDHIAKYNGDWMRERADNRIENLRWATRAEQRSNQNPSAIRIDKRSNREEPPPDEVFRVVDGIEVSQFGRTRNRYGVSYTPVPNKGMEYAHVGTSRKMLHVLVARAFPEIVGVPKEDQNTVDHINQNKADNRAVNLRWATQSEQQFNTTRKLAAECNLHRVPVDYRPPESDTWVNCKSCSDASTDIRQRFNRFIAAQSISQFIKLHPSGGTIMLRQNVGWSFRRHVDGDSDACSSNNEDSPPQSADQQVTMQSLPESSSSDEEN